MIRKGLAIGLVIILAAVAIFSIGATSALGEKIKAYYSSPNLGNPSWLVVAKSCEKYAKELGIDLTVTDGQKIDTKQIADVEDAALRKPDVIIVSPFDSAGIVSAVKSVNKAGIPLIILDIGITEGDYVSLLITNNYIGGHKAGFYAGGLLAGINDPKVGNVAGEIGRGVIWDRHCGFVDAMEELGIPVVSIQQAESRRDLAMTVTENMMTTHPDINLIFCENSLMTMGCVQALKNMGKVDVMVVGFDGTQEEMLELKEGDILKADVKQLLTEWGKVAMETALKVARGEEVPKQVDFPTALLTKWNVDEWLGK